MYLTWFDIFGFSLSGAILVIMALGIALSVFIPTLDKWNKRYFVSLFSLLFLCMVACFLALIFWYNPKMALASKIIYVFEDILLPLIIFMPTVFLLHGCKENAKRSVLLYAVMAFLGVYFVIMIATQFTKVFYYVTEDNQFVRGPLWAVAMAPLVGMLLLSVPAVIRRRKQLSTKIFIGLLVYMIPMTVIMIIHMFIAIEVFVVSGMALLAIIMYGLILSDNVEQFMRQQQEIAHQKASIMVLQMRPHFIYNSLMGIYYLCDQDSQLAKQVTLDFTTYLRKNFAAIASEEPIPFAEELEHTRAYLAVEQAQFEDSLFVEFDTPFVHFRIPPLTLQPIVENAVVHGLRASNKPIHISVTTRKTNSEIEIIVTDDGPGFAPTDNNEPHIALSNIVGRLKLMCKGTLAISPRDSGGTSVKVTIPLDEEEE
ncbi:MAG: histidine kinase [Clostridia bacterium]|nr:histidine kinase [Clostridia bacterium]